MAKMLNELNQALKITLEHSHGDPQMFAFLLTTPLSRWMLNGMLDSKVAAEAIELLHKLHPPVDL
jgi:hypothetical protein